MGKTVKITCDGCGKDLTTRTNSVDYRLVLMAEDKPGYGPGAYTDMLIAPPVDRAYYFCRLGCLDHWSSRRLKKSDLWATWWNVWKEENGIRDNAGRIWSYPDPSRETTDALDAEFEAAALAAFPMSADDPR